MEKTSEKTFIQSNIVVIPIKKENYPQVTREQGLPDNDIGFDKDHKPNTRTSKKDMGKYFLSNFKSSLRFSKF